MTRRNSFGAFLGILFTWLGVGKSFGARQNTSTTHTVSLPRGISNGDFLIFDMATEVKEYHIPSPMHPERIPAYSLPSKVKAVYWNQPSSKWSVPKEFTYGRFTWDKKSGEPISAHLFRDYKTYQQETRGKY